jgi:subtilase family serine protease
MRKMSRVHSRAFVLLVLVATAVAALAATTGSHRSASHIVTPALVSSGGPAAYQFIGKTPDASADAVRFGCQTRLPSTFPASSCYGPQQIWKAYGIDKLQAQGINGAGRSITIIDAYGDSNMQAILDLFSSTFGIPSATVNVIYPDGAPAPTDPNNEFGWRVETDLDVEWAHAVAPAATINLVVAKSNQDADIFSAQKYVADRALGDAVSQSFGENEACMGTVLLNKTSAAFAQMGARGQSVFASSGDDGAAQSTCDGDHLVLAVSSPAVDQGVTAVGGTSLVAKPGTAVPNVDNGDYISESVWNEYAMFGSRTASGGGVSTLFRAPKYQQSVPALANEKMRWVPDVAYNAAIQGGVIVAVAEGFFRVGGTSAGSPQWAGLAALGAQVAGQGLGPINPILYQLGTGSNASTYFHDVTTGNNTVPAAFTGTGSPVTGYNAGAGWDASTGLGSPKADTLVPALAATAGNGPKR